MSVEYVTPSPAQREELQDDAVQLQAHMRRAASTIGGWWAYETALLDHARRYGVTPADVLPTESVQHSQVLREEIEQWAHALQSLEVGTATLVPYQLDGDDLVRWGVAEKGTVAGDLGFWPVVFTVLRVSATALTGAAAWLLTDAHLETERLRAESEAAQAQTDTQLAQLAENLRDTDPQAAAAIAESIGKARAAAAQAQADTGGWLDTITGAAGTAAAGVGGLAIGALAVLAWLAYEGAS